MKFMLLFAAFAATMAGATKVALADGEMDCSFVGQEYDRLTPEIREEAEVVALVQHLNERCRAGATTAAAAVAQIRQRAAQLQADIDLCVHTLANDPGCAPTSGRMCQLACEATGGTFASGRCGRCPPGKVPRGRCRCGTRPTLRPTPVPPRGPVASVFCPEGTARVGQAHPGDRDCDGVVDRGDNCPESHNPGQEDYDNDGVGASCDDRDDLALHGAALDPLAARIAELERQMREHSHPGPATPPIIQAPAVNPDDWRTLFVLRDEFNRLAARVDGHDTTIADLDGRLRGLEGRINARLGEIEERLAQHQSRLDEHDARLDGHDRAIGQLREHDRVQDERIEEALSWDPRANGFRVAATYTWLAGHQLVGLEFAPNFQLTDGSVKLSMTAFANAGAGIDGGMYFAFGLPLSFEIGQGPVRFALDFGAMYLRGLKLEDRIATLDFMGVFLEPALLVGDPDGASFRVSLRAFAGDVDEPNLDHDLRAGVSPTLGVSFRF